MWKNIYIYVLYFAARLGLGGIRQAVISRRSDTKPEQGGHYGKWLSECTHHSAKLVIWIIQGFLGLFWAPIHPSFCGAPKCSIVPPPSMEEPLDPSFPFIWFSVQELHHSLSYFYVQELHDALQLAMERNTNSMIASYLWRNCCSIPPLSVRKSNHAIFSMVELLSQYPLIFISKSHHSLISMEGQLSYQPIIFTNK